MATLPTHDERRGASSHDMTSDMIGDMIDGDDSPVVWPTGANVVLTGFMGTGKSTVGRVLADRLGYDFVDTDDVIESRHGAIATIFAEQGEAVFRELENDVARELANQSRLVIATGGRFMLDDRNVAALAGRCRVVCLVAPVDQILERVRADAGRHERPMLHVADPRQRITDLLTERDEGYRRFLRISTDQRSPLAIADEIIRLLSSPPWSDDDPRHGGQAVFIGAGLMTVVSDLVGPVGPVSGADADKFRPQIATSPGGTTLWIGDLAADERSSSTVWVPTEISSVEGPRPRSVDAIILDVAVIQAASPGCVAWSEIHQRLLALVEQPAG